MRGIKSSNSPQRAGIVASDTADGDSSEMETSRIRVLIRVRPLNKDEVVRKARNVIERQSDQQITVWDPACYALAARTDFSKLDPASWSRNFHFDKTLWSVEKTDKNYANQDIVYEVVGEPVLKLVLNGFNCCVFAYGQTGSGKTLTMMGENISGGNPEGYGLIPRICFELFDALESNDEVVETVDFSHLEIYNENIKDLLAPASNPYLKVREHPQNGIFVAGLTVVRVMKFEDVMSLIALGDKNRSVAYTNVNAHSSRSHAIVTLTVRQRTRTAQKKNDLPTSALQQKTARLHLVDLAGSERVALSGATGVRLREAGNINRSLSVLGDVIKSLGDSRTKLTHIPYRNSSLTMILKDSLGGNSHVYMLANISPSSFDYEETISTLKFAERAKRVRLRVEANVTSGLQASDRSAVELVPLLQAEVAKLRHLLQVQDKENMVKKSDEAQGHYMTEMRLRVRELEQQLEEREKLIKSLETARISEDITLAESGCHSPTKEESRYPVSLISSAKIRSSPARNQPVVVLSEDAVDTALPRVINLNQDPLFSECLVYYIAEGEVMAGSSEELADILLTGPDIYSQHCTFRHEKGEVYIEPAELAHVYVNGELVEREKPRKRLQTCDRIALGRFHLFRFEGRNENRGSGGTCVKIHGEDYVIPDWEFAQAELIQKSGSTIFQLRPGKDVAPSVEDVLEQNSKSLQVFVKPVLHDDPDISYDADLWWDKLNSVVSGSEEASGPEELQEMMLTVVKKAEVQLSSRVSRDEGNVVETSKQRQQRHVTFNPQDDVLLIDDHTSPDRRQISHASFLQTAKHVPEPTVLKSSIRQTHSASTDKTLPANKFLQKGPLPGSSVSKSQSTKSLEAIKALDATLDASSGNRSTFEEEAQALQDELAEMQRNLKERMQRYSKLNSLQLPGP